MRITPQYLELQRELHARGNYGTSGAKHSDRVIDLCSKLKTRDVLDYGCGSHCLQKSLPFPIKEYDPCIAGFDSAPVPADIVICSDVLEHVEPQCTDAVLTHLRSLTAKVALIDISTRPAKKVLADGRNAHINLRHPCEWVYGLWHNGFNVVSMQTYGKDATEDGVVMLCQPRIE